MDLSTMPPSFMILIVCGLVFVVSVWMAYFTTSTFAKMTKIIIGHRQPSQSSIDIEFRQDRSPIAIEAMRTSNVVVLKKMVKVCNTALSEFIMKESTGNDYEVYVKNYCLLEKLRRMDMYNLSKQSSVKQLSTFIMDNNRQWTMLTLIIEGHLLYMDAEYVDIYKRRAMNLVLVNSPGLTEKACEAIFNAIPYLWVLFYLRSDYAIEGLRPHDSKQTASTS